MLLSKATYIAFKVYIFYKFMHSLWIKPWPWCCCRHALLFELQGIWLKGVTLDEKIQLQLYSYNWCVTYVCYCSKFLVRIFMNVVKEDSYSHQDCIRSVDMISNDFKHVLDFLPANSLFVYTEKNATKFVYLNVAKINSLQPLTLKKSSKFSE